MTSKPSTTNRPKLSFQQQMILKAVAYFCNPLSEMRVRSTTEGVVIQLYTKRVQKIFPVVIATGFHLFPFRTEKLSPTAPMVLHTRGRVGRRHFTTSLETRKRLGALLRLDESEGMGKGRRSEKTEGAQETVARRARIGGRLWVRHHKRKEERRTMAYI